MMKPEPMLRTVRREGWPNCLKNCWNGSSLPNGLCIVPSWTRLVLMLTTAGLRARVSATQFGCGTVATADIETGFSLQIGAGAALVNPRCGARATRPTTAVTTTASHAVRYRIVSRYMDVFSLP